MENRSKAFRVEGQYLKSLKIESPNTPKIFMDKRPLPDVGVSCDVAAVKMSEKLYEVDLVVAANALIKPKEGFSPEGMVTKEGTGEVIAFICEVRYSGLFVMNAEYSKEEISALLLVDAPVLLFPFVRRVIATATTDAGYPPLMLEPIDFASRYNEQVVSAQQTENDTVDTSNI